ncbi:MAG TPA: redox-regulated ATPase YchF [Vitreimonas sp.]|nr:redox-regulated ATPase YchF [Vitreimonas sp.]
MNLSIGIVGLPNVGKSTLFNALLKQQVALAANYPFATIDPNVGIAEVPDQRLPVLAEIVKTSVIKPATVEFVDIAGLVKGASQGAGLGNQFLSHIRETSAICHVLRAFTDPDIIREGAVSPSEDLGIIRLELQLADLATLDKQKEPKSGGKPGEKEKWEIIKQIKEVIEKAGGEKIQNPKFQTSEFQAVIKELNLLSPKPELCALNVDEAQVKDGEALAKKFAAELGMASEQIVIISAKIESELAVLSAEDQALFLDELGLTQSGLERLAAVAYHTLGLQSFLTAGELEVRAWTIKKGMTAPEAAGVIHTDFTKHFIKANVASYADFVALKGWKGVRENGKLRQEGRDYIMQEGDVVEFMIGK